MSIYVKYIRQPDGTVRDVQAVTEDYKAAVDETVEIFETFPADKTSLFLPGAKTAWEAAKPLSLEERLRAIEARLDALEKL